MKKNILLLLFSTFSILNLIGQNAQQRDTVKEIILEKELGLIDHSLVSIFKAGTVALDEQNYALADSFYTIVYNKAPSFDPAIRRLGMAKSELGQTTQGIELCEKAVAIKKSYANMIMLISCLINYDETSEELTNNKVNKAYTLLREARNLPDADEGECLYIDARIALKQGQMKSFKEDVNLLLQKYPNMMVSHYFAAIAASIDEEWTTAEKEIMIANAMGMADEDVESFLDSGVRSSANTERYTKLFLWIFGVWVIGFILLYLFGVLLSNYTLSSVEKQFKNNTESKLAPIFRNVYRFLINIAGIYYYISLPIVLILVVALVVGVFYLFLMIGRIPIQLMILLVIGSGFTIYGMIRSLLVKLNYSDPGRQLNIEEAPELFKLTKEVAALVGTRVIDEIRITPETDLAVYEVGTWKEKFQDNGKRILILGTGILKDFKQNDFKAVIAHEYGHFSNRDTAGGAVALRVRGDMHKYVYSLYEAGQNVWWNLAFQFLRLYDFIFRKISNGATRLQEILADRVAAQNYGAQTFQNGLTYVIRRNIEFVQLANVEIEDARNVKRSFSNLYELTENNENTIEEELQKSLNRETTDEDTHPSPIDRFRFVAGLGIDQSENNDAYVRDLFVNWNDITLEMTKNIEDSWNAIAE